MIDKMTGFDIGRVAVSNDLPLILIAGPCQLESFDHAMFMAERISTICSSISMPWVFKSSFDKANRTSLHSERGIGLDESLPIFEKIKQEFGCPVITDVHEISQIASLRGVVDILQIPAFLCRQTDLLVAAGESGCVVNIKKGQFLAPWDMKNVSDKVLHTGNTKVMLTERGTCFGYNQLVNDMKSLTIMANSTGLPIIFDATHSVQQPGGLGQASGGQREYIEVLARAAVAVGVAGVFIETHNDPDNAPSDGPCMLPISKLKSMLFKLQRIDELVKMGEGFLKST